MVVITRDRALEIIHKTYEAINEALKTKQAEHDIWLKDLSNRMEKINKLRSQKEYEDVIESLDTEGLQEYFNLVGKMAKALQLPIYRSFEDKQIAEEKVLFTMYVNGAVHDAGQHIYLDQGMRAIFQLETKNKEFTENIPLKIEWDRQKNPESEKTSYYDILNNIKNAADTNTFDREFAFEEIGEYKVRADIYTYMRKNLIEKIKTVVTEYDVTVIVAASEEKYARMEFQDKLRDAFSAVHWKEILKDSVFDVTVQLPILISMILGLSGLCIVISMSPIGWLTPAIAAAMQVLGVSGAVQDIIKGIYLFVDAIFRIKDAKSKGAILQTAQYLEEAFRYLAPNLLMDILLFLGGKKITEVSARNDVIQTVPQRNSALVQEKPVSILDKIDIPLHEIDRQLADDIVGLQRYYTDQEIINALHNVSAGTFVLTIKRMKAAKNELLARNVSSGKMNTFAGEFLTELQTTYGITKERFNYLKNLDYNQMTPETYSKIKPEIDAIICLVKSHDLFSASPGMMRKYIPVEDIEKYIAGKFGDQNYDGVRGFIVRKEDVEHLKTFEDVFCSMRLDYKNNPFVYDKEIAYIDFIAETYKETAVPIGKLYGGKETLEHPFGGMGVLKTENGQIIREYKVSDGEEIEFENIMKAEIYKIDKNGNTVKFAEYNGKEWVRL